MIDRAEIKVKAGDGGDGAISFRREKFVPLGGPDGGDGGNGGSVVIRAAESVSSLRTFRQKRSFRAKKGGNGAGGKKRGRNGEDLVIEVPTGTVVSYRESDGSRAPVADLARDNDRVVVAEGGGGGWGNVHYASSTNQAPRIAQRGETGEENTIMLEMRLIADVGIIGYPNAGKSTLLASASAARPKIDSYPFTTIEPVLGVVEVGRDRFVMAEIPGLVSDAHLGRGLGHDFLRHALRTRLFVHLLSGSSESPLDDMAQVNTELSLYDPALAAKMQIIALNKVDLPEVKERLPEIREKFKRAGVRVSEISAATGRGVTALMAEAARKLKVESVTEEVGEVRKTFRPRPGYAGVGIRREGDIFILSAPALERLKVGDKVSPSELRWQVKYQLTRMGAMKALEKAGIKAGDKVRCGSIEWEW